MVVCWCWEAAAAAVLGAADLGIPISDLLPAVVLELWLGPEARWPGRRPCPALLERPVRRDAAEGSWGGAGSVMGLAGPDLGPAGSAQRRVRGWARLATLGTSVVLGLATEPGCSGALVLCSARVGRPASSKGWPACRRRHFWWRRAAAPWLSREVLQGHDVVARSGRSASTATGSSR
jgi:hypothetical protein